MNKFFIPTSGPDDWQLFLAKPEKQWKKGFSARSLAYSWEEAGDFPQEIREVFEESGASAFQNLEMLLAFPEFKVPIPGGKRASQNDIFVLARASDGLVTIAVEGKVDEMFGPTLGEWLKDDSDGKQERLSFLSDTLDINLTEHPAIRYQLVHRTASAVILARNFHARNTLMLVHSFSQKDMWFEDYCEFVGLFGGNTEINRTTKARKSIQGVNLYFGWVKGAAKYLEK